MRRRAANPRRPEPTSKAEIGNRSDGPPVSGITVMLSEGKASAPVEVGAAGAGAAGVPWTDSSNAAAKCLGGFVSTVPPGDEKEPGRFSPRFLCASF
jgi:hypothetical protein